MNRFIDIIPSRCIACSTCRAVCSAGHRDAGLQDEPRLALVDTRTVAAAMTCHHCEGAPCYRVCPTNSIRQDPDGCIRVDESHCIGCKMCAIACPFGAIHMAGTGRAGVAGIEYATPRFPPNTDPVLRWEVGVYPVAVKCDLCAYNNNGVPRCVEACPTEALRLVELNDNDPDYLAKQVRQVQAARIMFENIDQAIPEGKDGLSTRVAAQSYLAEAEKADAGYLVGLKELGVQLTDAEEAAIKKTVPYNQVVEQAVANPPQADAVEVVEQRERERYLHEIETIPAGQRSKQVDTDNVIDQLSVGVTVPDMAEHATAYKRALDLQNAGAPKDAGLEQGIADELEDASPVDAAAGVIAEPKVPQEPFISHGDQVYFDSGQSETQQEPRREA